MISGIHNYCDKWCERCTMAAHCPIYEDVMRSINARRAREREGEKGDDDEFSKEMFEAILEMNKMIRKWAKKNGIDPDEPIPQEMIERDDADEKAMKEDELMQAARHYRECVGDWFESAEHVLKAKEEELNEEARLALPDADPEAEGIEIAECIDIILWYHTVIVSKAGRAVGGRIHAEPECLPELMYDANGSAKVVLYCIERSMAAWEYMEKHFPEKDDEILDFLVQLNRMREALHRDFPNARNFKRPGFDD